MHDKVNKDPYVKDMHIETYSQKLFSTFK